MSGVSLNSAVISLFLLVTSLTLRHVDTIILDKLRIVSVVIVTYHLTSCALSVSFFTVLVISESFLR